jgi:MFS family permease
MIGRDAVQSGERRRWIARGALCLGQLMMVLDATIVNVALPSMQHDLHFSQGNLTWVMNGYLITFGGFLLLAGESATWWGAKKVFLTDSRCSRPRRLWARPAGC